MNRQNIKPAESVMALRLMASIKLNSSTLVDCIFERCADYMGERRYTSYKIYNKERLKNSTHLFNSSLTC